jgi:phosphotransferase system HPr-like phosphotransfer protein
MQTHQELKWRMKSHTYALVGIHARPAGLIARVCDGYHAEIMWQNMRTGLVGSAKRALADSN